MPRNVRNFWLQGQVDGRSTRIEAGPVGRDGEFTLTVFIRGKGGTVVPGLRVRGEKGRDGELRIFADVASSEFPESVTAESSSQGVCVISKDARP